MTPVGRLQCELTVNSDLFHRNPPVHFDKSILLSPCPHSYAYDVVYRHGSPFLMHRRLFAFADIGVPDGIKCDMAGNVYSGCGDGVHVWSPGAELIGKIYLPDGHCANFCFGKRGEMFLLSEHKVWHVQLAQDVKGALLRI